MSKKEKLRGKDLEQIGYEDTTLRSLAMQLVARSHKHSSTEEQIAVLKSLLENPDKFTTHSVLSPLALKLQGEKPKVEENHTFSAKKFSIYGKNGIDAATQQQMQTAMQLPIVVGGALMPDAHVGYGLPIGGVLATENAVIPYGVGVDIGCRMCLSVYPKDAKIDELLNNKRAQLRRILLDNTRFGLDTFDDNGRDDILLDDPRFSATSLLRQLHDKAYQQIGSSGGGNHFVDMGMVNISDSNNMWGLPTGEYFALLSHSGSRGLGAQIAQYYTKLAMKIRDLPQNLAHLAWLYLHESEGQEYWQAMNLAGDYASACHHHIHRRISKALGVDAAFMVENHHNFAWKEQLNGREVIVHRKGATPAKLGELGIIPGSMASPAFIVAGRGNANALQSAAHGAGRLMSRSQAIQTYNSRMMKTELQKHAVELIGGGIDESPFVYKDIAKVMQAQSDLVDVLGVFHPKVVRMAAEKD
jgi:tRNA-splicing ligase RtcB